MCFSAMPEAYIGVVSENRRIVKAETVAMEVLEMNDQEINEAVARKMGWKKVRGGWKRSSASRYQTIFGRFNHDYTHHIEAAWEIINAKRYVKLERQYGKWICWIGDDVGVEAETAPMAICKAFLKLDSK
jgi:hypothetical protein